MVEFFCCCIPIRLGTILLAALMLFLTASSGYVAISQNEQAFGHLSYSVTLLWGVLYIVMAVISLFGLIGSVFSSRRAVRLFSRMLWGMIIVALIVNVFSLVELFEHKDDTVASCVSEVKNATDANLSKVNNSTAGTPIVGKATANGTAELAQKISASSPEDCSKFVTVYLWAHVAWYAVIFLLQMYFAGVTSRFANQLDSEYRHHRISDDLAKTRSNRASISRVSVATVSSLDYDPTKPHGAHDAHGAHGAHDAHGAHGAYGAHEKV